MQRDVQDKAANAEKLKHGCGICWVEPEGNRPNIRLLSITIDAHAACSRWTSLFFCQLMSIEQMLCRTSGPGAQVRQRSEYGDL
jgi:hypothetical protein